MSKFASKTPADIDARLVEVQTEAARLRAELAFLAKEEAAIADEFDRRGGWSRSFLVSGGHLHSSTACSTCFPTTSFYFIPALSGATEGDIVAEAGERACTVCFPTAPVDVLSRPSKLHTPDEAEKLAARTARDEARAQKAADAIVVEGLDEYRGHAHTFKSERAVSNFIASQLKSVHIWNSDEGRPQHPSTSKWLADAHKAATVLASVRGVDPRELFAELDARAAKSAARELKG